MTERQKLKIVECLHEAHALELAVVRQLQAQITVTPVSSYRDGLEDHLEETRRHAWRLEKRLDELGRANSPLHVGLGALQSVMGQVRDSGGADRVLRDAKDACAAEAQEIATYTALARLARRVNDNRTERLAISLLRDERRMLDRLLKAIPRLTDAVARAEFDGALRLVTTS